MIVNSQAPIPNISHPNRRIFKQGLPRTDKKEIGISVASLLSFSEKLMEELGIESTLLDAQLLMAKVLKEDRLNIFLYRNQILSNRKSDLYLKFLAKRLSFEPMAYILGNKEFFGLSFEVNKNCLIPRPDTESLVEHALGLIPKDDDGLIIDVCAGSGAISISLLHERKNLRAILLDICPLALQVAKRNAKIHGVSQRAKYIVSDLFSKIEATGQASLIVSNPPYIGSEEYEDLMPEVRRHEPKLALAAFDKKGLSFYDRLLKESLPHLKPGGYLLMEIPYKQVDEIMLMVEHAWCEKKIFNDLSGRPRVVMLRKAY